MSIANQPLMSLQMDYAEQQAAAAYAWGAIPLNMEDWTSGAAGVMHNPYMDSAAEYGSEYYGVWDPAVDTKDWWNPTTSKNGLKPGKNELQRQQHQYQQQEQQFQGIGKDNKCNKELFKTELCNSFMETGDCRYGGHCQFAHGSHELRPVQRHPKYKTKLCKNFSETGSCPYGIRCRFIHSERAFDEEDPLMAIQHLSFGNGSGGESAQLDSTAALGGLTTSGGPGSDGGGDAGRSRLPFFAKLEDSSNDEAESAETKKKDKSEDDYEGKE
eukprot:CAMPEP_0182442088 /NCGR_PEP_ID=MMETSP1172-20130603/1055_1 /TAXON_ID=708627 /ORGANISM="Timspurckia oligopyrenoides, Strain CCMP3278" /LENGTH=270 /DNA_ID=CAMNT_0024636783 /DNA_START=411 /DNA_END=1223 /DNA_ORIENTATION=-